MEPRATRPVAGPTNRGLLLVAGGILALLIVTVGVVLLAGGPRDVELVPGSPEAVLEAYLAAFDDGDFETAYASFSTRLQERWNDDDYRHTVESWGYGHGRGISRRVLLDRAEVSGDSARVHLTIEEFYGDGLGGDTYRTSREIRMVREDSDWRIDQPLVWLDPAPTDLP